MRLDREEAAVARDQRDDPSPAREHPAHLRRMPAIGLELLLVDGEHPLIGGEAFGDETGLDDGEVGDYPAAVLEDPVIGQADELALARDVGGEGKGAAGEAAVVALAEGGALALDRGA